LLELIQDVASGNGDGIRNQTKKFPAAAATLPFPRAAAAGANSNDSHPAQVFGSAGQATLSIPFSDHHNEHHSEHHPEQEDYLWGV